MRKNWKILWIILRSILIFILLSFTMSSIMENVETEVMVNNFKKKGVYQEDLSTETVKYYKIEGNHYASDEVKKLENFPGNTGDILVSRQQNTVAPFLNEFISFYAGGHVGYCGGYYRDYEFTSTEYNTVEASGNYGSDTRCRIYDKTDWSSTEYFTEVIGLSVDMTDEERDEVSSLIFSYRDDPYNFSFLFDTVNKSYCTDLLSKAFKYIGKDLNYDGFTVSVYDLILSKDTYISYYHYVDNGIKYIYYLG